MGVYLVKTLNGIFVGATTGFREADITLIDPVVLDFFPMQVPGKLHGQMSFAIGQNLMLWPSQAITLALNSLVGWSRLSETSELQQKYLDIVKAGKVTKSTLIK